MEVFSNLFYILVIGIQVLLNKGSALIISPQPVGSGSGSGSGETSGSGLELIQPGPGVPIYDDCVAYEEKHCTDGGPYFIKARNAGGYERESEICANLSSPCDGGGWTEIGTIPADEEGHWSYDSEAWTAKGENQACACTNLNSQFWSANVSEVCLQSDLFNIKIPVVAPSLRSLFTQKRILDMSISDWTNSLTEAGQAYGIMFDPNCSEIGFNVGGELPAPAARLGITSTHGVGCESTQSNIIGIGLRLNGTSGSYHGLRGGNDEGGDAVDVHIYVRSRPIDEP